MMPKKSDTSSDFPLFIPEGLGERIAEERRRRGWSQRELGRRCGLRHDRISKIERQDGQPSLLEAVRLVGAFEIGLEDLVFGAGNRDQLKQERTNMAVRIGELEKHFLLTLKLLLVSLGAGSGGRLQDEEGA